MRVPCQKPFAPATGPVCNSYSVARSAAPRMVTPSRTIHSLTLPRETREGSPTAPPAHSGEEDTEAETLCQNSDVAISVLQTSRFQDVRGMWGTCTHKNVQS